eukprot:Awhi_evm1s2981
MLAFVHAAGLPSFSQIGIGVSAESDGKYYGYEAITVPPINLVSREGTSFRQQLWKLIELKKEQSLMEWYWREQDL